MMSARSWLALTTIALAACHGAADGPTGEPARLEWLDAPAPDVSLARRVSGDGQTVIGSFGSAKRAFRWTRATGFIALPTLPASEAVALCADGSIVLVDAVNPTAAFYWTDSPDVTPILGLDFVTDTDSDASVSVGTAATVPTILSGGVAEPLFATPPDSADVNAVSADGATVVGRMTIPGPPQKDVGFVWTATSLETIEGSAAHTDARDVSADGAIVVGSFHDADDASAGASPSRGFVRSGSDLTVIGPFTPSACDATAAVVVGNTQNPPHAYVWNAVDGTRELGAALVAAGADLGGATLEAANDVSADGRVVVGQGRSADGKLHAFRAVLPR
jgi:uncharacterized membrane protein